MSSSIPFSEITDSQEEFSRLSSISLSSDWELMEQKGTLSLSQINEQGLNLFNQKEYRKAIQTWLPLTEQKQQIYSVNNNIGLALEQLGQFHQAQQQYKKQGKWFPKAIKNMIDNMVFKTKQIGYSQAIQFYKRYLQQNSNDEKAYNNLGVVQISQGDSNNAFLSFKKSMLINPIQSNALINMGIILNRKGKFLKSKRIFIKALERDINQENGLLNLANNLYFLGKHQLSIAFNKKVLKNNKFNLYAENNLKNIYHKYLHKFTYVPQQQILAIEDINFLKGEENHACVLLNFAKQLFHQSNYHQATLTFIKVIQIDPRISQAFVDLGLTLLICQDELQFVRDKMCQIFQENTENQLVILNISIFFSICQQRKLALKLIDCACGFLVQKNCGKDLKKWIEQYKSIQNLNIPSISQKLWTQFIVALQIYLGIWKYFTAHLSFSQSFAHLKNYPKQLKIKLKSRANGEMVMKFQKEISLAIQKRVTSFLKSKIMESLSQKNYSFSDFSFTVGLHVRFFLDFLAKITLRTFSKMASLENKLYKKEIKKNHKVSFNKMRSQSIEVKQNDSNFSKRKRMKPNRQKILFSTSQFQSISLIKSKKWKLVKLISDNLNVNYQSLQEYLFYAHIGQEESRQCLIEHYQNAIQIDPQQIYFRFDSEQVIGQKSDISKQKQYQLYFSVADVIEEEYFMSQSIQSDKSCNEFQNNINSISCSGQILSFGNISPISLNQQSKSDNSLNFISCSQQEYYIQNKELRTSRFPFLNKEEGEKVQELLFHNHLFLVQFISRNRNNLLFIARHFNEASVQDQNVKSFELRSQRGQVQQETSFKYLENLFERSPRSVFLWISCFINGIIELQQFGIFHADLNCRNTIKLKNLKNNGSIYKIIDFDYAFKVNYIGKSGRKVFDQTREILRYWLRLKELWIDEGSIIQYIFRGILRVNQKMYHRILSIKKSFQEEDQKINLLLKHFEEFMLISHKYQFELILKENFEKKQTFGFVKDILDEVSRISTESIEQNKKDYLKLLDNLPIFFQL